MASSRERQSGKAKFEVIRQQRKEATEKKVTEPQRAE